MTELLQRYNADQLQIPQEELWAVEEPFIPEPEPEPGSGDSTHITMKIQTILTPEKLLQLSCTFYGPRQLNLVLIAYASSEGSGEPTHLRSLARTFAACSYKQ